MSPRLRKTIEDMEGGGFFQNVLKTAFTGVSDAIVKPRGFHPSQVKYGWLRRPFDMPPLYDLAQLVASTYQPNTTPNIQGYTLLQKTPTVSFFQVNKKRNVIIIALRGTSFQDVDDLKADLAIVKTLVADVNLAINVENSQRYIRDVADITAFKKQAAQYSPRSNAKLVYYAVGHSLSGALIDDMLLQGLVKSAVSFNPAIERVNFNVPNDNHRVYLECDVLYNLIGKFITNGNLEVISKANPAGADAGPIDTTMGTLDCHNITTVIPLMSGKGINNNIGLSYKPPMSSKFTDLINRVGAYREDKFQPLGANSCKSILEGPITMDYDPTMYNGKSYQNKMAANKQRMYDECMARDGKPEPPKKTICDDPRYIGMECKNRNYQKGGSLYGDIKRKIMNTILLKSNEEIDSAAAYKENRKMALAGIPPTVEFMTRWLNDRTPAQQLKALRGMPREEFLEHVRRNYIAWRNSLPTSRGNGMEGGIAPMVVAELVYLGGQLIYKFLPDDAKAWVDGAVDSAKQYAMDVLKEIFDTKGQQAARAKVANDAFAKEQYDKGWRYNAQKQVIQFPRAPNGELWVKLPDPRTTGKFVWIKKSAAQEVYTQLETEERIKRGQQGQMGKSFIDYGVNDPEEIQYQKLKNDKDGSYRKELEDDAKRQQDEETASVRKQMGLPPKAVGGKSKYHIMPNGERMLNSAMGKGAEQSLYREGLQISDMYDAAKGLSLPLVNDYAQAYNVLINNYPNDIVPTQQSWQNYIHDEKVKLETIRKRAFQAKLYALFPFLPDYTIHSGAAGLNIWRIVDTDTLPLINSSIRRWMRDEEAYGDSDTIDRFIRDAQRSLRTHPVLNVRLIPLRDYSWLNVRAYLNQRHDDYKIRLRNTRQQGGANV